MHNLGHDVEAESEALPGMLPGLHRAHVLAAALFQRFSSRGEAGFQDRLLSAMRFQFGGHKERPDGT